MPATPAATNVTLNCAASPAAMPAQTTAPGLRDKSSLMAARLQHTAGKSARIWSGHCHMVLIDAISASAHPPAAGTGINRRVIENASATQRTNAAPTSARGPTNGLSRATMRPGSDSSA